MLSLIRKHKLGVVLWLVGSVGLLFLAARPVSANHAGCSPTFYNRCIQHGYATGQPYNIGGAGTYVMSAGAPSGISGMPTNNVNEFVGYIFNRLHDGAPGDANAKYQDTTGAAFIVNTMLGRWGTDYGNRDASVVYARNNFAEWERRVRWYDSQGLVQWNTYRSYLNFENSLYDRATRDNSYYMDNRYEEQYTVLFFTPGHGPGSPAGELRDFFIKKNCGNPVGANYALRPVPEPEGVIQGYKVVNPGLNPNIEPPKSALVTSSHKGGRTTRNNPYFFTDVPADDDGPGGPNRAFHRVTVEVPAGWRVGYNVCYQNNSAAGWRNPCDNGRDGVTWGNTVVVDVYVGNPVNVWWHYERLKPPAPTVTTQCIDGNVTAQVRWDTGALPPTRYVVDIDDSNSFNQFWNKDVPSGTNNTDAPAGFSPYPSAGPGLVLRRGQRYHARIFYVNSNEHSDVMSFDAPSCWHFDVPKPNASATLRPDESSPTSVDFGASFTVNYSPPGAPNPQGVRLRVTRAYFIRKASGAIVNITPAPNPNPDNRWFNGPDTFGKSYSENRGLPASLTLGDEVCVTIRVSPGSGSVDSSGNVTSPGPDAVSDEGCAQFMNKSYFKVFGGDISAGFTECRGWTAFDEPGAIISYSFSDPANRGKGSGTQLAAFALGEINEFSSAVGRASEPTPHNGLTFANDGASGPWGGRFKEGFCAHDYYGTKQASSSFTGPNLSGHDGDFQAGGGAQVQGTVDKEARITLYVDGNVHISGNILYAEGGGWRLDQIPSFTLVARGNIYIGANVTEVSGVFIAQPLDWTDPNSAGGQIYTCSFGFSPPTEAQLSSVAGGNNCRNQLTINGAFIAKRVRLLRTAGSLGDSNNSEGRTSASIAERFIFSPEVWLSSGLNQPSGGSESYDSITILPPVL